MNRIYENMNKIIDAFCLFYGEENRAEITSKFSRCKYICYEDPNNYNINIRSEKNRIKNYIFKTVIEKCNDTNIDNDKLIELFKFDYDFYNISTLALYEKVTELYKLGEEKRREAEINDRYNFIKRFDSSITYEDFINQKLTSEQVNNVATMFRDYLDLSTLDKSYNKDLNKLINELNKIYSELTIDNFNEYYDNGKFNLIDKIVTGSKESISEYNDYINNDLKPLIDESELIEKNKKELTKKYIYGVIDEFKNLLSDEDIEQYNEIKSDNSISFNSIKGIEIITGSYLGGASCLDYFSEDSDNILNDPEANKYRKSTIIENRIKYFNYRGINLGDNYDDYINNQDVKNIWPSHDLVNNIIDRKKYYLNQYNISFYGSIPSYIETKEEIEKLRLLDKDISFSPEMYTKKLVCVNPNVIKKEDKYELYSLLLMNDELESFSDVRLIHELNHLFELTLLNVDETNNKYQMITGWDYFDGDINQMSKPEYDTVNTNYTYRDNEVISEVINELIAQDITSMMHQNNMYILNNKENAMIKGGTGYEKVIVVAREFYNTYKNEIIESRRNNNMQIIIDKVGKENFDNFNNLLKEFNDYYSLGNYYRFTDALKNNKVTEDTIKFEEFINNKNTILQAMSEYSNKKVI